MTKKTTGRKKDIADPAEWSFEEQVEGLYTHFMGDDESTGCYELYKSVNKRMAVLPHQFLYRNKIAALKALARGQQKAAGDPFGVGATVAKWRKGNETKRYIQRLIVATILSERSACTIQNFVTMASQDISISANSIRPVVQYGVELGLLVETAGAGGRGATYAPTRLLMKELFERMLVKYLDDDFIEMCRSVVAFDEMRKMARHTFDTEKRGFLYDGDHQSLSERIVWGDKGRGDKI